MSKKSIAALATFGACLFAMPEVAFAQAAQSNDTSEAKSTSAGSNLRISTGINFSKGDYGEIEDTEVFSVPVSLTYRSGNFKVRVSVPWVHIDGPGSLIQTPEGRDGGGGGTSGDNSGSGSTSSGSGSSGSGSSGSGSSGSSGGGTVVGTTAAPLASNRRSGIGDVNVAMTYSFDLGGDFYFEPTAKVKLPTASVAKRLGTGQVDVTLSADIVKNVGPASFYLHGRRKFAGKPDGSTIRSTWGLGGGASVRAAEGFTIGADYDWQQSAFLGRQPSSEVTGWANLRLSRAASLTFFASTGLNANSVDISAGTSISIRF